MKNIISVILILVVIMSLVSCRKMSDYTSSSLSTAEIVDASLPESSSVQETPESEIEPAPQEQLSQNTFTSTIVTPKEVIFYKGGKFGVSTNEKLNLDVAKCVEAWYKNYENDTLPLTKTAVSEEMIVKLKQNETVVEICFSYDQEINLLGKIILESTTRLLIPLTGNQAYYVFRGNDAYRYQNGLHAVKGSGLEKYFKNVKLDKDVKKWESTVIAPTTVTFYKDGMQSVSYNKEFNHKIAKHIESWFQYEDSIAASNLSATTDLINQIKRSEMAIELQFDSAISFYSGVIGENTRTLFIPITGKYAYDIFQNTIKSPDYWGGPIMGDKGLEQFFEGVKFTPLTEEEKRWRSTTNTPGSIEFYENGKLVGESGEHMQDYSFNNKIALHIESWFYKRENVETITISDIPIEDAWRGETYVKMWFGTVPTFYGKQIIDPKNSYVIIPLTGDYAYCIFEGTYEEMSNKAIDARGYDLEQFFEKIKTQ